MADNKTGLNAQYEDGGPFIAAPLADKAPGSAGATEADTMADTAFSAVVNGAFDSVQNVPPRTVGVGLDDTAVPGQGVEGISGSAVFTTGAGQGRVRGAGNPNAGSRA